MLKDIKQIIKKTVLFAGVPLTLMSSIWLKIVKKYLYLDKIGEAIFMKLGILPILDHYYEPLINPNKYIKKSLRDDRRLPGIDFNANGQLKLLSEFNYNDEILKIPLEKGNENEFYFNNLWYSSGDAEYLYNIIRHYKPKRIIEVGSGYSTMMARNAVEQNKLENTDYTCQHICIEPYECLWLEKLDIEVVREKVEIMDLSFFQQLESGDILFIDSSHIIRPQGDVLFEYLEILPLLNSGVVVHIHDIFSPKDYLDEWIYSYRFWNEQYLLEAFLTFNSEFKIIGALNYLAHNHREEFADKCPYFAKGEGFPKIKEEPRAFWIIKN